MHKKQISRQFGFTLIEVMIVVAIIAILAAIAIPSYDYVIKKKNRSLTQQFMLELVSAEERYILDARQYANIAGLGFTIPADVSAHYTVTATPDNAATPPSYVVQAVADTTSSQNGEPTMTINSAGQKTNWD